jgi:hypothetical protein
MRILTVLPPGADDRQPSGDQGGVEGPGSGQPGHRRYVRRVQRLHLQLRAALVERVTIGGECLHHRQVRPDENQEHRLAGQFPVPRSQVSPWRS